jgi:hypothetical protein
MLNNLRTHKYQALILDSPVVQYFAAQVGDMESECCKVPCAGKLLGDHNMPAFASQLGHEA